MSEDYSELYALARRTHISSLELEVGKRYLIEISDCCISGELIGTFEGYDPEDLDDKYPDLCFDIGKLEGRAVYFHEVVNSSA